LYIVLGSVVQWRDVELVFPSNPARRARCVGL